MRTLGFVGQQLFFAGQAQTARALKASRLYTLGHLKAKNGQVTLRDAANSLCNSELRLRTAFKTTAE